MVSIPDWGKFSRLHENLKEPNNVLLNKYYKQREEQAIRQAEERGYFKIPTKDYIVEESAKRNGAKFKDTFKLRLVKLCGVHLRKIGELSQCLNLRICILNNNFLTKIDGLMTCHQLIKLDLHSNQLTEIPNMSFWSGMRKLEILLLHDNPLGRYETLQSLATCPSLVALSLYDTPLSLKRNYRHHVANSIWTLKALDHHVISDEEIIEDAVFGGKFGTLHSAFKIDLSPPVPDDTTFEEEKYIVQIVIAEINYIQAHHSPVLIIQRFIRGFLARKKSGFTSKRTVKSGIELPIINNEVIPPPPSCSPVANLSMSHQDVQYDTYYKNRPDSSAPSETMTISSIMKESGLDPYSTPAEALTPVPQEESGTEAPKKRKNLLINLAKLQSGTFSTLYDEAIAIETILPDNALEKIASAGLETRRGRRKKKKEPQKKIVKSVKQFFGPVVDTDKTIDEIPPELSEEEMPITEYRLRGMKPEMSFIDATTEMILEKQEAGRLVRDAEDEIHIRARDAPKLKVTPRKTVGTDQRIFSRVHGTMGISSLLAVHQAYKDREKAEKTAAKMEHILNLRDERERAKERIRLFQDEKRNQALKKRDQERARMLECLEQREMKRLSYLDRKQDIKARSLDMTRSFKADFTFITEFSNQHTSVSNALMRHDKQSKQEDMINQKTDIVEGYRSVKNEQQDVVNKYLEHRQLMRQTESAMAKNALDARMLQEANDRLMEAKQRVAQQKARRETVQAFYPLPQTLNPAPINPKSPQPVTTSLPATPAAGATHFEANVIMSQGRLGKHPTLIA